MANKPKVRTAMKGTLVRSERAVPEPDNGIITINHEMANNRQTTLGSLMGLYQSKGYRETARYRHTDAGWCVIMAKPAGIGKACWKEC